MESLINRNQESWNNPKVVRDYVATDFLYKPEQKILNILRDKIKGKKMLDLGVGGGRTTVHFAELVGEYVGVDYSETMIKLCIKRFGNKKGVYFTTSDARSLSDLKNDYFDFVLFSFNGLDYVNDEERGQILKEIRRVLKDGGYFAFSSHNLDYIDKLYLIHFSLNPFKIIWRFLRVIILLLLNGTSKLLKKNNSATINDGAHGFRLKTYYIKTTEQIRQLEDAGFEDIQIYSLYDGEEKESSKNISDPWIYYLGRLKK